MRIINTIATELLLIDQIMFRIIFYLFVFLLHYLWTSADRPVVHLVIQQCNPSSAVTLRSFLVEYYEKFLASIFHSSMSNNRKECQSYRINLHLSLVFFIVHCSSIFDVVIHLFKILSWFYRKQCYYILQKQIQPFIHIRSVALMSPRL